jgi:hypothetical protein
MDEQGSVRTAVCTAYEKLLEECQHALMMWNQRRIEIHDSGLHGKAVDDELRKLQARYAKAYARLRNHVHDCETCKWVLEIERRSAVESATSEPHQLSA